MADWHVTYYDDDTGYAYRVRVKRLTVGDAVHADMLGDEIALRDALHGRELLTLSQSYPFIRYATASCERAIVTETQIGVNGLNDPTVADDAQWEPFELTEAAFMALPEWLAARWQMEAIRKNPHRDPAYEALKKKVLMERLQTPNAPGTPSPANSGSDSEIAS